MAEFNVEFFKPFVDGTTKTIEVQCSMPVKCGKPFYLDQASQPDANIAGVIGFSGSDVSGSIAICFPEKIFLAIMGNMLGEEFTEMNPELRDGAAELLNIIYGQAKIVLNEKGYEIEMAIPTVVTGEKISAAIVSGSSKTVVIPFEFELGEFTIQINLKED